MFYASRFMTALSELESAIVHHQKSDEDAMFALIKQSKAQGMKPLEAAASYFVLEAERGLAAVPEKWLPMARQAVGRIRVWSVQEEGCQAWADRLLDLVRDAEPDEA
jgi:formate dehydrogenase maturation protein FdhE